MLRGNIAWLWALLWIIGRDVRELCIISAGLDDAAKTTFRVCALGALTVEALEGFMAALERAMAEQPVAVGV